jgi:hypothetical protein
VQIGIQVAFDVVEGGGIGYGRGCFIHTSDDWRVGEETMTPLGVTFLQS